MAKGTLTVETSIHSDGHLRCSVLSFKDSAWAKLHHADQTPHGSGIITIFLRSHAEIAAFRALSEALAAQDVVEEVVV